MPMNLNPKSATFTNGSPNDATPLEQQFIRLFNNDATIQQVVNQLLAGQVPDSRSLTLNFNNATVPTQSDHASFQVHRGALGSRSIRWNETSDAWEVTHNGTTFFPLSYVSNTDPSPLPSNGSLWVNTTDGQVKLVLNNTVYVLYGTHRSFPFTTRFQASSPPAYVSSTSLRVDQILCRSADDTDDLRKLTATTLSLNTFGLNGVVRSAALSGFVTVTAGSSSVTGVGTSFTTDFVIGDTLSTVNGQSRRITAITGNSALSVESAFGANETNVVCYRGGTPAPNTDYYLYAVKQSDGTIGLVLSSRCAAVNQPLVDLPQTLGVTTAVTVWRQFPFAVRLLATGQMAMWHIGTGWPYNPEIFYTRYNSAALTNTGGNPPSGMMVNTLNGGETALIINTRPNNTWLTIQARGVPRIAQVALLNVLALGDLNVFTSIRLRKNATEYQERFVCAASGTESYAVVWQPLDELQNFQLGGASTATGVQASVSLLGYAVTLPC
ncbi:MAG: hypothetical protein ACKO37_04990 [Vampirovibrionales bacterium]